LIDLLGSDLDFHDKESQYSSHNFHSFPAKFPPQLPQKFILGLTQTGEVVLDPMSGSGTTVLEAYLNGRLGVGFDIDPLAIKISNVKVSSIQLDQVIRLGDQITLNATLAVSKEREDLENELLYRWDQKTKEFIDYWFSHSVQLELIALVREIETIASPEIRKFFELAFSSTIITKSGGVSLALDLGHTRPHKAKVVFDKDGKIIIGDEAQADKYRHMEFHSKKLRSPIDEFEKKYRANLKGLTQPTSLQQPASINFGDAQYLPIESSSVDLIVTSPPYAQNAIDYMRAHKFSLVWFGYKINELSEKRNEYIGGEFLSGFTFEALPTYTQQIVQEVLERDKKKALVLHRYYSEMTRVLNEMYRVLKPGKAAILVVGSSVMRGRDTETQNCLADIGRDIGFDVPLIGERNLDRNRRMLPAGMKIDQKSQIQQRMHVEYVIGFLKP